MPSCRRIGAAIGTKKCAFSSFLLHRLQLSLSLSGAVYLPPGRLRNSLVFGLKSPLERRRPPTHCCAPKSCVQQMIASRTSGTGNKCASLLANGYLRNTCRRRTLRARYSQVACGSDAQLVFGSGATDTHARASRVFSAHFSHTHTHTQTLQQARSPGELVQVSELQAWLVVVGRAARARKKMGNLIAHNSASTARRDENREKWGFWGKGIPGHEGSASSRAARACYGVWGFFCPNIRHCSDFPHAILRTQCAPLHRLAAARSISLGSVNARAIFLPCTN